MTLHISPQPRFPQMTDTGDEVLLTCDCKSAAAVAAAGGAFSGSGETYTENGVLLSKSNSLNFTGGLTAEQKAKMEHGFVLTVWIESGFFDNDYLAGSVTSDNEYILGVYNSAFFGVQKLNGVNDIRIRNANGAGFSASGRDSDNDTRGAHTRVDLVKMGGKTEIYLDYFPFINFEDGPLSSTPFNGFVGIGASQFGSAPQAHRVKDFMITTNPFQLPVSYELTHVSIYGHSYIQQGDYTNGVNDGYAALSYAPGNTTPGSGGVFNSYDLVMCPVIHKRLNQLNIGLGNGRLFNHSMGGVVLSGTNGLAWQIAQGVANHSSVTDVAIVMLGANEVAATSGDWDTEYGAGGTVEDWEILFQAQIDALIAIGATKILLLNQPYLSASHPTSSGQAYLDRVDGCNVMIDSLVAANSECYLVDVWSAFGGTGRTANMFGGFAGVDPIHPSVLGSKAMGDLVADKLIQIMSK